MRAVVRHSTKYKNNNIQYIQCFHFDGLKGVAYIIINLLQTLQQKQTANILKRHYTQ